MFIGHYGVSLAAKRASPALSLALLFLAVQLLDVLFSIFILFGVEKMNIVHGFTAFNPYDLYWMPYSHSLVGALVWSVLVAGVCWVAARRLPARQRNTASLVLGAAVFSHFVLDVPVHTTDLPLWPGAGAPKIGMGLWNHRRATIVTELAVLAAGGRILCSLDPAPEEFADDRTYGPRRRTADPLAGRQGSARRLAPPQARSSTCCCGREHRGTPPGR